MSCHSKQITIHIQQEGINNGQQVVLLADCQAFFARFRCKHFCGFLLLRAGERGKGLFSVTWNSFYICILLQSYANFVNHLNAS